LITDPIELEINMPQDSNATTTPKAQQEREIAAKQLKEENKGAKEMIECALLKEQMADSKLLGIPKILEQVMNDLLISKPESEQQPR
jgi:hypothetical protein